MKQSEQSDKNKHFFSEDITPLQTGQIEIKAYPDEKNEIAFYVETWEIEIDWGDSNIEFYIIRTTDGTFRHKYPNQNCQTIKINSYNMVFLNCGTDSCESAGTFMELRFGYMPNLQCFLNELTTLDVSNCTALTCLMCYDNFLSASALNTIFNSLPTRVPDNEAEIWFEDNLGFDTCDKTIFERKGWIGIMTKPYNR